MRRSLSLPLSVLAAGALVLTPVLAGSSAAAPAKSSSASASSGTAAKPAKKPAKPAKAKPAKAKPTKAKPTKAKPAKPAPKPSKAKAKVVVVGVVTSTATKTVGTATSTVLTIQVQGGHKEYKGKSVLVTVDKGSVVKRNHGKKKHYDVKQGDKVTVHARRAADGALTATYVAASGRPATVVTGPPATSTATTTATTEP